MNNKLIRKDGFSFLALGIFIAIFLIFAGLSLFVSHPVRATKVDHYILFNIDEIFSYSMIRNSLAEPVSFLNPSGKALSLFIATFFYRSLSFGMASIRIMNSFFSVCILFVLYKLARKLGFRKALAALAVLFTLTTGLYFILSISVLSEMIFTFFLILAIYSFYSKKYLSCSVLVSLLPLLRMEGFLYLGVYAVFLLTRRKFKHIALVLLPAFLWVLCSKAVFGYSFLAYFLRGRPPAEALVPLSHGKYFFFLFYQPLIIFSLIGALSEIAKKKLSVILAAISTQFIFWLMITLTIFVFSKGAQLGYDFRFMLPVVPLLSIYAIYPIDAVRRKLKHKKLLFKSVIACLVAVLFIFLVYSIQQFQKIPEVKERSFNAEQEMRLETAGDWLNDHLIRNNYDSVYVPNEWIADASILRLHMYLSDGLRYYTILPELGETGSIRLFDMVSFKTFEVDRSRGIFLSVCRKEDPAWPKRLSGYRFKMINAFPDVPLYLYALE